MGIMSHINLAFSRIQCLTLFYYIAHIFGLISAIVLIVITVSKSNVEKDTVGEFKLNITAQIQIMFYVSSGILILTVTVGYLAQRWPDKSSLWILYCILLSIVSVVMIAASVSAHTNAHVTTLARDVMLRSMEDEDNSFSRTKLTRWDRLQTKYKCCGTDTYQDWQDVRFGRTSLRVPKSCCHKSAREKNHLCGLVLPVVHNDDKIYTKGCREPALKDVRTLLNILSGIGFAVAATHTLLTLLSCYLVVSKKV